MSTFIGQEPPAIMESIQVSPPGKQTVTMTQMYHLTPPVDKPPDCPVKGLLLTGHEAQTDMQGGFGKMIWKFEGGIDISSGDGEGGGGGDEFASPNELIELSVGVDQVPIGMHPKIKEILSTFGGTVGESGEVSFPEKDPTGTSTRKGVDAEGNEFELNPFYGVTSFFSPRATFRIRRMNVDPDIYALGKLDDPPYMNTTDTGLSNDPTNWIKTGINRREHGNATEVTEEWLYSLTGWEKKIYEYA